MDLTTTLAHAAKAIAGADALLITAGAGMGVDSGLPDFRGPEGFWRAYPALAHRGIRFEQMANPEWFQRDPQLAWAFYGHRLNLYRQTQPHRGFELLRQLAQQKSRGCFVFTSNVDGQFQKAGFAEDRIVECHGSIHHFQCCEDCQHRIWPAFDEAVVVDEETFAAKPPLPRCPHCSRLARPNILMFGDWMWNAERTNQQMSRLQEWLDQLPEEPGRLAIVELGAGSAIPTVRHTSEELARRHGGILVRINLRESDVLPGHLGIALGAKDALERIVAVAAGEN